MQYIIGLITLAALTIIFIDIVSGISNVAIKLIKKVYNEYFIVE